MDVKDILPAEAIQAAISKQVMDALTPDMREKLMTDAISSLLKLDMSKAFENIPNYGRDDEKYEIETARKFHNVVALAVRQLVGEQLKTDLYKEKLSQIVTTIIDKMIPVLERRLAEDLEEQVQQMVENMLTPKSRY